MPFAGISRELQVPPLACNKAIGATVAATKHLAAANLVVKFFHRDSAEMIAPIVHAFPMRPFKRRISLDERFFRLP